MDNHMIQQSLDYIEDNLQAEITAGELADVAGFSLFHYYRLFQQATGFPVMQYILRRRLLHGIYAIARGSSKTDAAFRYGFDTYAGFYKAFCREFGSTPSDFIQSNRAKKPWRINLSKEEHMTVTHKKIARILHHWDLRGESVSDIYFDGTGNKNETACNIGKDFILKHTGDPDKLRKQIEVSKSLEQIGLTSPVPVPTTNGADFVQEDGQYFYLTRRLQGNQMVSHRFGDGDGRFVGEILGQLHLALEEIDGCVNEADLLSTVRNWALPKTKEALQLPDGFCTDFLTTFAALYPALSRQVIHRDPNPGNIICTDDSWGFIDFDLAERNVRIYDPCYAATAVLSETFGEENGKWLDIFRDIIRGYDSVIHLTEAEQKAIPYVILANQFVCVAWFAEQEKYAEIFETNKKMTLWLIRNFEELGSI